MKIRDIALLCAFCSMLSAGAAAAQSAVPQYTPQDIIDTFAKPAGAPDCASQGMAAGEDGVCEPLKDSRGFSLPSRAAPKTPAPAARPAQSAQRATARRTARSTGTMLASASAPTVVASAPRRDLLINFKLGSAEMTPQAKANARVFAQAMNTPALSAARFEIEGHTDVTGTREQNQALSQARADALKAFLVAEGVNSARLNARGYAFERLATPSNPRSPANRRVEARRVD